MSTKKTCPVCERGLPLSDFGQRGRTKDGLTSACKKCETERQKKYRKPPAKQKYCQCCGREQRPGQLDFNVCFGCFSKIKPSIKEEIK